VDTNKEGITKRESSSAMMEDLDARYVSLPSTLSGLGKKKRIKTWWSKKTTTKKPSEPKTRY
jgi:hypothetical protein